MRYTLTLTSLFAAALAADLSIIPSCARECISSAVSAKTACAATDVSCICASREAVTNEATPCVLDKCGLDVAVGQVLPATAELCAAATVTTTPTPKTTSEPEPETTTAPGPKDGGKDDKNGDDDTEVTETEPEAEASSIGSSIAVPEPTVSRAAPSSTGVGKPVVTAGAASFGAGLGMVLLGAAVAL